jgi:hypothetical protein
MNSFALLWSSDFHEWAVGRQTIKTYRNGYVLLLESVLNIEW